MVAEVVALRRDKPLPWLVRKATAAADKDDVAKYNALQQAAERTATLSNRATVVRTLVEAQKVVIGLERKAYDLDATADAAGQHQTAP